MTDASVDSSLREGDPSQHAAREETGWDIEDVEEDEETEQFADTKSESTTTTTSSDPTTRSHPSVASEKQEDDGSDAATEETHAHEGDSMFDCNICLEQPEEPVVTMCGHLFCWACLYKWLELHPEYQTCPVCKAGVTVDKVIPLYGRGKEEKDPRTRKPESSETSNVPRRPQGQRAEPVYQFVPPFSGLFPSATPFATTQFGNVSFSAGFSIFPSLLGLQFVTATGGAPMAGNGRPEDAISLEQQQQQAFLSRMLFMLGTVVVIFLLLFN
eukprot:TRINITY_DN3427_c0_g1_i3.p1 TRINITY_DN3427_c0_g1~~TRINITY_DN3427_c0_g1_i3.p1  ORF type:complete len:271 (-),score=47.94 TRINITY_DN3427_c0_g1_i3:143-955(-)